MSIKNDSVLQKKGVENMSLPELRLWLAVCIENEESAKFNKARRSWKTAKENTRIYIKQKSKQWNEEH